MRDECFIRGKIPMTKSEVRAVSLSKLELCRDSIVYDIGAGTGSVSVEAALAVPDGHVYAFEQKEEGCELIRKNQEQFKISNLTIVPGKAPESMKGLPAPDRVFIGGTGGSLELILDRVLCLNPEVRIVINAAALETLAQVTEYVRNRQLQAEVVSVQIARARLLGSYHLMQGLNPVYVITLDENALDENALDENVSEKNALKENALKENALKENLLKENALKENALNENTLNENTERRFR